MLSRRGMIGLTMLGAGVLALSACALAGDATPDYRYRLTVEVETPEGLRSGSSVIEVRTAVAPDWAIPTPGKVSFRERGEAVAVDVSEGRTLYALLRSENDTGWAGRVMFMLAPEPPGDVEDRFLARYDNLLKLTGPIELPRTWPAQAHLPERSAYPMLVTFADPADPASVALVDPDDLAATFGEGTRLKRLTVELTDDPVTTGIEKRLGWLDAYRGKWFNGRSTVFEDLTTSDLAAHLTAGSFSTEYAK